MPRLLADLIWFTQLAIGDSRNLLDPSEWYISLGTLILCVGTCGRFRPVLLRSWMGLQHRPVLVLRLLPQHDHHQGKRGAEPGLVVWPSTLILRCYSALVVDWQVELAVWHTYWFWVRLGHLHVVVVVIVQIDLFSSWRHNWGSQTYVWIHPRPVTKQIHGIIEGVDRTQSI